MVSSAYNRYTLKKIMEISEFLEKAQTLEEFEKKFDAKWSNLYRACKKNGVNIKKQKQWYADKQKEQQMPRIKITQEIINELQSCKQRSVKSYTYFYVPYEIDITATICGDPAPGRSALHNR